MGGREKRRSPQNQDSLDKSIQNLLSALYPPFEATAPTVLSQLFQVIEGRYQGDALRCLLDFLVPAKHILESVQQAACALYSDVIFLCEGWPLCLRDQVLIHLAPIHPPLLRPGDFYLQVAPFAHQSARIVVCSLLEEEGLWVKVVEETPVPETCYPCLFTSDWLQEINRGRHGTPLSQCLLATEQGLQATPRPPVENPQTSVSEHTKQPSAISVETRIRPAKHGIAVSLRLVDTSASGPSRLVRVTDPGPTPADTYGLPEPRDLSHCARFSEGPCTPCMMRRQSGKVSRAQELRCRYRDSYQAAIQNPVAFARDKEKLEALAALEEEDGDGSPKHNSVEPDGRCSSLSTAVVDTSERCELVIVQGHNVRRRESAESCAEVPRLHVPKLSCAADILKTPQPGSDRPRPDHLPLPPPETAIHPLYQGLACLTGGRDRSGRAVVQVYGDHHGWRSPATVKELYQMLLHFHTVIRREVRELGMVVVIDARRAPPPPQFFKAMTVLQSDVLTSTKALYKAVEPCHLTSYLDGTLQYSHRDWLELHQKLHLFVLDLHESSGLLLRAIRKLEEKQKFDTVQEVQQCIVDQRTLMRDVLGDSRVVGLQREGGATLARLRRESDLKYPHREDFSDAVDSVTSLYNCVEEQAHVLVQRSNVSMEHLEYVLQLRELEAHFQQIREWFGVEGERHLLEAERMDDSKDRVEQTLNSFTSFLIEANDRNHHAESLVSEAERLQGCGRSYPEAQVFGTLVQTLRAGLESFLARAEVCCRELLVLVNVCDFCEQATALATECIEYLDLNHQSNCLPASTTPATASMPPDQFNCSHHPDPPFGHGQDPPTHDQTADDWPAAGYDSAILKSYQERFLQFSLEQFQEVRCQAGTLRGFRGMRAWNVAWLKCQEARQQLQERVQEVDEAYLRRQHAALSCDCGDTDADGPPLFSDGEDGFLQSTPGPSHPQWEGVISGAVELDKRRPILGRSSSADADSDANVARSNQGSKVVPASPQRSSGRDQEERVIRRDTSGSRGRSQRDAAALSQSHTVGCQWFPWGRRGLAARRSLSEESCATVLSPPADEPPSSCSHHGQPSCRILQEAQMFQLSRHGSFCSQESYQQAYLLGADGAVFGGGAKHSSLPTQRHEGVATGPAGPHQGSSSNALRLQRVMEELVHTEREYVRSLGYILTHYHPLLERPDIPQDLRGKRGVIFGNLEKLYDFHAHYFLPELEVSGREPAPMARCFLRHSESFGLYALYSKNKPKSDALILHRRHDIFKRKQQELGDMMDLSSYLLRPVQRISKYSLLLQDMLALAPAHHPQYQLGPTGGDASTRVPDVSGGDREREKAEIRAAADLVKFQMRHGNDLLTMDAILDCDGQLIRQDEFTVLFRKKKCVRRVFLFEHLILFSKTKRNHVGNDVYAYKQSFKLWIRRRKREDTYTLKALSLEVKRAWTADLERILWEQAAHKLRMQERVFMGIERRPFMDILPSEAAICDRAVPCTRSGKSKHYNTAPRYTVTHLYPGDSGAQGSVSGGLEYPRPNSIGSGSTASTTISLSSSSSGRGSLPPIGYLGSQSQGVELSRHAVCSSFSSEALVENELNNLHLRQHHPHQDCEQRTPGRLFIMESESSGDCVNPFRNSEQSCLSVVGGEVAVDSSSSFAYPSTKARPPLSRSASLRVDGSPALIRRKPIGLEIERCDLEIKSNNRSHRTELNGQERLIVRRGQAFSVTLHLKPSSTAFNPKETDVTLIVETGPLPRKEAHTKVSFGLKDATDGKEWSASAANAPGNTVSVTISSSPDAPIGGYSLSLDHQGQSTSLGAFILLFNACESKRQEYVLSQHGLLYRGAAKRIQGKPWNFSQFEPGILDICLKLLDDGPKFVSDADKDCSDRRSPVYITRVLSAMGVLVGEWEDFSDGVHPSTWIGSGDILRQWVESGPVCYGQCWVFAALDCTVSRALGIPCRVVTNFNSAHDADANLLIEKMYDEDGERISDADSVWNFHVWVESWMARPDLEPADFDGWQASDATPQETSEDVRAIREGELTQKFDAPFVFAEVNADVVEYVRLSTGDFVKFSGSTDSIGQNISTKAVGKDERRDITHHYKYPEGSEEERSVFEKAQHRNKLQKKGQEPGLRLKVKLAKNMIVGSDFEVYGVLTNNSMEAKSYNFMLYAQAVLYNNTKGKSCGFSSEPGQLAPGEEKLLFLVLKYSNYGQVISPDRMIQVTAFVNDKQNKEYHKAEKLIVLDEPDLEVKLVGEARVDQPLKIELCLRNPLPEALQDCCFTVEGVGLTQEKPVTVKLGTVAPKQEAKGSVQLSPREAGSTVLLVDFHSDKLKNIKNFVTVLVKE
ncbi:hypothetical protein NHX12_013532 [Muraenolepis orangiensis]|uniref:DH domain-containing protein n=1 Tax=Muraenolepis orangiensis TaxID=630683 RepID=A0A9Q0I513_9TELE|nr:hypothetical protein NHX12_013532 [Muraenolepis orangiensis]